MNCFRNLLGVKQCLEKKALRRQHARAPEDSPELLKEKDVMGEEAGEEETFGHIANSLLFPK
jgi:hypothetical protein